MAVSFQSQFDHAVRRHADEIDIAAMQTETWLDRLKRAAHSRFQIEWMQAVEDQKIRNQRIVGKLINQLLSRHRVVVNRIQHAFERVGMHLQHDLDQFARLAAYWRVRRFVQGMDQLLHAGKLPLKLRVDHFRGAFCM